MEVRKLLAEPEQTGDLPGLLTSPSPFLRACAFVKLLRADAIPPQEAEQFLAASAGYELATAAAAALARGDAFGQAALTAFRQDVDADKPSLDRLACWVLGAHVAIQPAVERAELEKAIQSGGYQVLARMHDMMLTWPASSAGPVDQYARRYIRSLTRVAQSLKSSGKQQSFLTPPTPSQASPNVRP